MRKRLSIWLSAALATLVLASCGESGAEVDVSAHRDEVVSWRADRLAKLLDPYGYLTQTGLYWLKPGRYSVGTAESNDVVFAGDGEDTIGVLTVDASGISMTVDAGVDVRHNNAPVESIKMAPDNSAAPVTVTHRNLAWTVVERVGRFGVRLRDFKSPFVDTFGPLRYFDIDRSFRVNAVLRRYPEPIIARGATVIEGLEYRPESPGVVVFEIDGVEFELEAFTVGDELFYVFGDLTNRDATYPAGRFLYSATPGEDGKTVLDFNKAYSPPCAFNDFSTCPIASPQNRLAVRIEAGEYYDEALHYSGDH